jgi:hypothetical protein
MIRPMSMADVDAILAADLHPRDGAVEIAVDANGRDQRREAGTGSDRVGSIEKDQGVAARGVGLLDGGAEGGRAIRGPGEAVTQIVVAVVARIVHMIGDRGSQPVFQLLQAGHPLAHKGVVWPFVF